MIMLNTSGTLRMQKHCHTRNNVQKTMLTNEQNEITVKINLLGKTVALHEAIRERSLQYDDNKDLKLCTLTYIWSRD